MTYVLFRTSQVPCAISRVDMSPDRPRRIPCTVLGGSRLVVHKQLTNLSGCNRARLNIKQAKKSRYSGVRLGREEEREKSPERMQTEQQRVLREQHQTTISKVIVFISFHHKLALPSPTFQSLSQNGNHSPFDLRAPRNL